MRSQVRLPRIALAVLLVAASQGQGEAANASEACQFVRERDTGNWRLWAGSPTSTSCVWQVDSSAGAFTEVTVRGPPAFSALTFFSDAGRAADPASLLFRLEGRVSLSADSLGLLSARREETVLVDYKTGDTDRCGHRRLFSTRCFSDRS